MLGHGWREFGERGKGEQGEGMILEETWEKGMWLESEEAEGVLRAWNKTG